MTLSFFLFYSYSFLLAVCVCPKLFLSEVLIIGWYCVHSWKVKRRHKKGFGRASLTGDMPVQSQYMVGDLWVLYVFRSFTHIFGSSALKMARPNCGQMSSICGHLF